MYETQEQKEKVILFGVQMAEGDDTWTSLLELKDLADTAGAETVGYLIQNREAPHPGTYLGKGKIEELKEQIWEKEATGVICDDELSPAQLNNLTSLLNCKVMDRTLIILDIFAARASFQTGRRNRYQRTGRIQAGDRSTPDS
jgi:GTP-binding protein HflX